MPQVSLPIWYHDITTGMPHIAAMHTAKEALWLCSFISEVFRSTLNQLISSQTTNRQLLYFTITSIMLAQSTLTFIITSFTGLLTMVLSVSFTALWRTWLWIRLLSLCQVQRRSTLLQPLNFVQLEGECCNSKLGEARHKQFPDMYYWFPFTQCLTSHCVWSHIPFHLLFTHDILPLWFGLVSRKFPVTDMHAFCTFHTSGIVLLVWWLSLFVLLLVPHPDSYCITHDSFCESILGLLLCLQVPSRWTFPWSSSHMHIPFQPYTLN